MLKYHVIGLEKMIDRYKTPVNDVFSDQQKLNYQLMVEREIAYAHYQQGTFSKEFWDEINEKCQPKYVKLARVQEIEEKTHHDLMSVVMAISEQCPTASGFIHLGATSMDIQDTVLGLQLQKSKKIILESLNLVIDNLARLTSEHRYIVSVGRTHGQHAIPMTQGFKFANFLAEFMEVRNQITSSKVAYGKISGAIGTYASYQTQEIEKIVLSKLNLNRPLITTQIIPRILFMPFLSSLVSLAGTSERLTKEIRNLQRPEIREWFEGFTLDGQIGSSTMPQKRNPHKSERISGLTRVIRHLYGVSAENIATEHERDLTNSAPERITFPDMLGISDYILRELTKILLNLQIDHDSIQKNLQLMGGRLNAEAIMIRLAPKIGRQKAHALLLELSNEVKFGDAIKSNKIIGSLLSSDEIDFLLKPENYIGLVQEKIDEVLKAHESSK